jgi:FkbM family methyltransferase
MRLHSVKRRMHTNVEEWFGVNICRRRHGQRDWVDIKMSGCVIKTIFDVGANIGQSAIKFRDAFPSATIHCFEPVQKTFQELVSTVDHYSNVHCHQNAMGSRECILPIYLTGQSVANSLIMPSVMVGTEDVTVLTIDDFASENQIARIDLLKIDTEGFDLEVLQGAQGLLGANEIAFVLAEVGFHPGDTRLM